MFLGQQSLTVTRQTGSYVDGVWTLAADSTFGIVGSIQQLSARELQLLPEGERTREQRILYSLTQLRTAKLDTQVPPDEVTYDGRQWRVQDRRYYDQATAGPLQHYRYRLVAVGDDE